MARPRFSRLEASARRHFLETAAVEFAARGFDGTSLNGILDKAGVSKGSFYYYFDDKADLFLTVVEHAWKLVLPVETVDVAALSAKNYWSALNTMMQQARVRVRENPWLIGITRMIYDPPDLPGLRGRLDDLLETVRRWRGDLIRHGQSLGAVRSDLPVSLMQALVAGADEAVDRWFADSWSQLDDDEIERLFAEVFEIFRRMLQPPDDGGGSGRGEER